MTNRGKIVLTFLILGIVGFGAYRWWDQIAPTGKPTTPSLNTQAIKQALQQQTQQAQQAAGLVGLTDHALAVHPTQLYEAGAELSLFWLLVLLRPHKRFHGQLLLIWLAAYSVIRSIIEMFRGDKERGVYILSTSQFISIGVILAAAAIYWHLRSKRVAASSATA